MTPEAEKIVASLRSVGGVYDYVAAVVEDRAPSVVDEAVDAYLDALPDLDLEAARG